MSISPVAMVYAAGLGTRMGPLTANRPKALIEVAGRALLDRALDVVEGAGIAQAVVNLHYHGAMIRHHLAGRTRPQIAFSDETGALLDTGGGLQKALPLIGDLPVLTINSDTYWNGPNPMLALIERWDDRTMDGLMLLMPVAKMADPGRKGDFVLDGGGRVRWPNAGETADCLYTGLQVIHPKLLDNIPGPAFPIHPAWNKMMASGRCFGICYDGHWVDVGRPGAIAEAEAIERQ